MVVHSTVEVLVMICGIRVLDYYHVRSYSNKVDLGIRRCIAEGAPSVAFGRNLRP